MKNTTLSYVLVCAAIIILFASCKHSSVNNAPVCDEQLSAYRISQLPSSDEFDTLVLYPMQMVYPSLYSAVVNGDIEVDLSYLTTEMYADVHPGYTFTANDTIFNVLNFGNNSGFAVYAEDYGLVALTNSGHLDVEQYVTIGSVPLEIDTDLIKTLTNDSLYSVTIADQCSNWLESVGLSNMSDPLIEIFSLIDKHAFYKLTYNDAVCVNPKRDPFERQCHFVSKDVATRGCHVVDPMVELRINQWQPLNRYCPVRNSSLGHTPVGCGPVAIAMLFSVYGYPIKIRGRHGDWSNIISESQSCMQHNHTWTPTEANLDILAHWLYSIGAEAATQHYDAGSWTLPLQMMTPLLLYNRYKHVWWKDLHDGDTYLYTQYASCKKPVIVFSDDSNHHTTGAHYFVVDGCCKIIYSTTWHYSNCDDSQTERASTLVHVNWGWLDEYNGYFDYMYGFDLTKNKPVSIDEDGKVSVSDELYKNCVYDRWRMTLHYDFN